MVQECRGSPRGECAGKQSQWSKKGLNAEYLLKGLGGKDIKGGTLIRIF